MKKKFETVDQYIAEFPNSVQLRLKEVRKIILSASPDAKETISYNMPAYKTFDKPLVYFAGYKRYTGFYATPTGHAEFKKELAKYKQGKGSVQFPHQEVLPSDLIEKMVKFRTAENEKKYGKIF